MQGADSTAAQYDALGDAYAADNDQSAYNAYYERPATIALLGDVSGRRVLEVGCGPGALTVWLVDHDASVMAVDISPEMVKLATTRVGDRATIVLADASKPLAFIPDGSIDIVVASLVLHYIRDWVPVLSELRRLLARDGVVVFSTHHPAMDWQLHSPADYFAIRQVTEVWKKGDGAYDVTFWRRPLTAITDAISASGFLIESLVEPEPAPALRDRDPRADAQIRSFPTFIFFRLIPRWPS